VAEPAQVTVVIPAFNEQEAIADVVGRVRGRGAWREVLVVDDGSTDLTAERAAGAGARVVRHPYNKGNGAAVKTGIREAKGDVVLLMDADGQHDPEDMARLVAGVGVHDMVIGARASKDQSATRALGNAVFNGFSYPTTSCLAFMKAGYNVTFVPVAAHPRVGTSKIRVVRDGVRFILIILKIITLYSPLKVFFPISAVSFLLGLLYGIWNVAVHGKIPMGSALLIQLAVVVFLFGLISEQIAAGNDRA
jgi:glycosyltransferase involved in cell wall biosynthesis